MYLVCYLLFIRTPLSLMVYVIQLVVVGRYAFSCGADDGGQ